MLNIGNIHIRPIQRQDTIEIFEISAENKGLGPGYHVHRKMEESFYIVKGVVQFTVDGLEHSLGEGESLSVTRGIPHSWKIAEEDTKMLLIFTPAQNQLGYFSELEEFHRRGSSWQEAISSLAHKFDNTPVTDTL